MKKILKYLAGTTISVVLAGLCMFVASADEVTQTTTDVTKPIQTVTEVTVISDSNLVQTTATEEMVITTDNSEILQTTIISDVTVIETEISQITTTYVTTISSDVQTSSTAETTLPVKQPDITAETVTGWNSIDGKWFYFDGEKFLTGKQKIDDEYYVFAANGALRTGWVSVNFRRYYYDKNTHSIVYGWINYLGNKYYNDKQFGKLSGMHKIDGNTYIFDKNGIMITGFTIYENFMYYCDVNGAVVYGDEKKTPILIGENYHLISPKGYVLRGWQTVNGKRYYYDYETGLPVYGWILFKDSYYYVDKETGKYVGDHTIDSFKYRFNEKGIFCKGYQYFKEENITIYFYEDTTYAINTWIKNENYSNYFDENGHMTIGWKKINGKTYYFDKNGRMVTGIQKIDGNRYYFNNVGHLQTGFQIIGGELYLFDKKGIMQFDWQTVDDETYYFDKETGIAVHGWKTIDEEKYYFDYYGVLTKGKCTIEGKIYYFDDNGKMLTGWQTVDDETYYFDKKTGFAVSGWQIIDEEKYYFDYYGVLTKGKCTIEGKTYYFGNDGRMRTGWQTIDNEKYYFSTDKKDEGVMYTYRHNIDGQDYLFYSTGVMVTNGNQNIVNKALSQLGQEGGQPYWTWWGFNFRIEWCACFVSWCATQCGYTQQGQTPKFISCKIGIDWFKEKGQWMGKNYKPKSGDYIFFDWEPDGIADHIGIVDYYEDGYVYTVEGNSNDEVRKKVYDIKSKNIYGFAAPDFLGGQK